MGEFGGAGECGSDDRTIYPGSRVALAGAWAIKCHHLKNIYEFPFVIHLPNVK